ncbi:MAG: TIGR03576 family pyridoxal phosphate-dependent enzyme [Methanobacteriaceae archaeon]|nr:TIGR03576 family pyridoxal phosphate-dependent enzyme [Methanobacteriaceae archaeon]
MLVNNSVDEVKKRESALKNIREIMDKGSRKNLYDLTGLSGGFLASDEDLKLLETYIGPAIFEEKLQKEGIKHLGGEKVFAVNRTSSGILATILALVPEKGFVLHFLKEHPAHPSIPRSCKLVHANYLEYTDIEKFRVPYDVNLVIITGSTMDHQTLDEKTFKHVINLAHKENIPVLVDDASGARLRTAIFNQRKATELGADLVVTSTDKLMKGPRGGLMAGKEDLIDLIKSKATQFGLEAQPPSILAMVKGLEDYNPQDLRNSLVKKEELLNKLNSYYNFFKETPTGVMVKENDLYNELNCENPDLTSKDLNFLWAMIMLKYEGIITIPAVGMPGASATIRFDIASPDSKLLTTDELVKKIDSSLKILKKVMNDTNKCYNLIFE